MCRTAGGKPASVLAPGAQVGEGDRASDGNGLLTAGQRSSADCGAGLGSDGAPSAELSDGVKPPAEGCSAGGETAGVMVTRSHGREVLERRTERVAAVTTA